MTERMKEKLKILLAKEEIQAKEKTEQPVFLIGHLLSSMRLRRNYVIEDVAEGICGIATLERLEHGDGEGFPDYLLLVLLFNRMGVSAEKFELYYDKIGEEHMMLRKLLVKWRRAAVAGMPFWENQMDDKVLVLYQKLGLEKEDSYESALKAYTEKYFMTWEKRWAYWQKLIYELANNSLTEGVKKAWEELSAWKLYYTEEEWEFLYALAGYFRKVEDYEKANAVYARMYQNVINKNTGKSKRLRENGIQENKRWELDGKEEMHCQGMDEERQLELLPEFCLVYGKFLLEYGKTGEADVFTVPAWDAGEIFLHGIRLNRKFSRDYMLYELMEAYCSLLYGRIRSRGHDARPGGEKRAELQKREGDNDQRMVSGMEEDVPQTEEEIRLRLLQYEEYLAAWEIVKGSFLEAKKRLDFMKEELQWENTTLLHTYNVLARWQG